MNSPRQTEKTRERFFVSGMNNTVKNYLDLGPSNAGGSRLMVYVDTEANQGHGIAMYYGDPFEYMAVSDWKWLQYRLIMVRVKDEDEETFIASMKWLAYILPLNGNKDYAVQAPRMLEELERKLPGRAAGARRKPLNKQPAKPKNSACRE